MRAATSRRMRSVSSRSGCVTATMPKSWSWSPTLPPGLTTRAISCTTRSGSGTCRMTVTARATSKPPALNGSRAPSARRSVMRPPAATRHSVRATYRIVRLGSTPTTVPPRPTSAATSRSTTPVPQPTSSTRAPFRTGTKRRKRRRRRVWAGVRPRCSRVVASRAASGWASTLRHGSGGSGAPVKKRQARLARRAHSSLQKYVTSSPVVRLTARDFTTYVWQTGSFTSSSPPTERARRTGSGRRRRNIRATSAAAASQRKSSANRTRPSAVGLDGDGPEELLVLRRELGRGLAATLLPGEEDPGVGTPPQDLLHGFARRLGRLQGDLDDLQELLHQQVHVAFSRHRAPYDTIAARWPPAGRASAPRRATRAASSRSARTSGG